MSFNVQIDKSVAHIFLDTNAQNTLTTHVMTKLIDIFQGISQNKQVRVAFLQSSKPEVFSFGLDPAFMLEQDIEGRCQVFMTLMSLIQAADELEVPLITDINGAALAGGAVLALLGDFSIANDDHAKVCFSEVKVGLPVPPPIFELLRRRCSESLVREMLLTGRNMKGRDLEKNGIVSNLYHSDKDRDTCWNDLVGRLCRIDREVLSMTLKSSKVAMKPAVDYFLKNLNTDFVPFLSENYLVKGLKAVIKGESPQF